MCARCLTSFVQMLGLTAVRDGPWKMAQQYFIVLESVCCVLGVHVLPSKVNIFLVAESALKYEDAPIMSPLNRNGHPI
jgi:hypothetical protein